MGRKCFVLAFALVLVVATAARAGAPNADTPAVVVRVKSLGALFQNLDLVVKLVGQDEAALAIEGVIKGKIGKKGLAGIDLTRPFGAYVRFGKTKDEFTSALLIPIADEKAFLTLIANLDMAVTKDKTGIYTHKTTNDINVYFRFAHGYVFIAAVNTESLQDKNLVDPAKTLAVGGPGDATISVVARIDRIPVGAKEDALKYLDAAILAAQKDGPPNESKAQEAFRVALLGDVNKLGASLIHEAAELRFDLDVRAQEISVNLAVAGKPNSDLAKAIKNIGALKSPLAVLAAKNVAFHGNVHFALPEELNKSFGKVIDEVVRKSLEGIQNDEKKKQAEALFKALLPTAQAGEFQIAAVALAVGPKDDRHAFVGALKLTKGDELGTIVRDLLEKAREGLKELPKEQGKIQVDFDKADKIHRFELPKNPAYDKLLDEIVGDRYLYLAFRADALFLALGENALPALKTALATKDVATSVPFLFDFDIARMAKLLAKTPEHEMLAGTLFPKGQSGRVRLAIEGGDVLSVRLRMHDNVLKFLVKVTSK